MDPLRRPMDPSYPTDTSDSSDPTDPSDALGRRITRTYRIRLKSNLTDPRGMANQRARQIQPNPLDPIDLENQRNPMDSA